MGWPTVGTLLLSAVMPYKDADAQRAYAREWIAKRRQSFMAGKVCAWCGSTFDLQLDHIDPATKVSHQIWSWSLVRQETELAKCQVLCRPCHEKKTGRENSDRMGGLRHGTEAMYGKKKCRCEPCRQARKVKKAENRARRKALGLPYQ